MHLEDVPKSLPMPESQRAKTHAQLMTTVADGPVRVRIPLPEKRALSVIEVSDSYGVCRATVYNLINAGKLPSSRVLGRRLIPRDACEALFIDSAIAGPIASTNQPTKAA